MSNNCLSFQDGTILDDNSELALIDAVLPDIVTTRRTLLQNNRPLKPDIKHETNIDDSHYSHDNYKGHSEIMDIDGPVNDIGNQKAILLTGHESEV